MYFVVVLQRRNEYLLVDCHYLGINNDGFVGDAMKDEQSFCSKIG
jgi:hypothetical protein